ncbi:GTPase-activating protein gyp7 [Gigaspora margarita]|uniref:GTPase-activating protein gyp7 n=1 Tax=Gigaspora margarita TaxID=4874 RepID=A0A8H4A5J4_GIGMA|nr:GTPase-activating protein gyp7 [Gigaspora margarita]
MDPLLYKHLKNTESNLFFCFSVDFDMVQAFHLLVGVAILDKYRMVIIEYLKQFDEILKYINDSSTTIPVDETLLRAETLFHQFQRRVEIIDRKRSSVHPRQSNLGGSLRRRVSESVARNSSTDEGSSSDAAVVSDRLPVIANC